jgi:hypothetical protein
MISQNERAVLLLRMIAEATRNDILNVETISNALDNHLSIPDLIFVRMTSETITECYLKLLRDRDGYGTREEAQENGAEYSTGRG